MKKSSYIILACLFATVACTKEYLDKQPLDKISDAVVWSDPNLINAFLTTQYHNTSTMSLDATTVFDSWSQYPNNTSTDWVFNMTNSEQEDGTVISSFVSDECRQQWAELGDYNQWKTQGISIGGGLMEYWENPYKTIRNLNEFIVKVKTSPVDPDIAKLRVAEARFLRAFNYFSMVKRYGGVPLVTVAAPITAPHDVLYPKRNTEKEVYDFVIGEMDTINADLALTTEYGRANQEAALALKCRAALYAGSIAQYGTVQLDGLLGIPASEANDYYQKAYDAAHAIIQGGKYSLYNEDADKVQNFKNIFLVKHNSEAIMAIQHDGVNTINNGGSSWSWDYINCPKPEAHNLGNTTGVYLEMAEQFENSDGTPGTLDRVALQTGLHTMADLWKNKDPRFYASIWTCGTPWPSAPQTGAFVSDTVDFHKGLIAQDGVTILNDGVSTINNVKAWSDQVTNFDQVSGFGVMKYLDPTADNLTWFCNSKTDVIVFRYGEVLLNFAEAAFELGHVSDALDAVNQIRGRAGMPAQGAITRDLIRHERQIELAFEDHRYWDLRRWRIATTELSKEKTGLRYILDYNTRKFKLEIIPAIDGTTTPNNFTAINYYFPITNARTAANPNLVENPGY